MDAESKAILSARISQDFMASAINIAARVANEQEITIDALSAEARDNWLQMTMHRLADTMPVTRPSGALELANAGKVAAASILALQTMTEVASDEKFKPWVGFSSVRRTDEEREFYCSKDMVAALARTGLTPYDTQEGRALGLDKNKLMRNLLASVPVSGNG